MICASISLSLFHTIQRRLSGRKVLKTMLQSRKCCDFVDLCKKGSVHLFTLWSFNTNSLQFTQNSFKLDETIISCFRSFQVYLFRKSPFHFYQAYFILVLLHSPKNLSKCTHPNPPHLFLIGSSFSQIWMSPLTQKFQVFRPSLILGTNLFNPYGSV